jgi:hypothetical protein
MNIKTLSYGVALLASLSLAPLNNSFASLPSDLDTSCTAASAVGCLSKIQSAVPTIADAAELDKVIGYLASKPLALMSLNSLVHSVPLQIRSEPQPLPCNVLLL